MVFVKLASNVIHDGKSYGNGDHLDLTVEQANALIDAGVAQKAKSAPIEGEVVAKQPAVKAPKPPTKKELLGQAAAEGLEVDVDDRNTVAEVVAAIDAARAAKAEAGNDQ